MNPRRTARFAAGIVTLSALAGALGCAAGMPDEPIPPLVGPGVPAECVAAFPLATKVPDLASAPLVPDDWPDPPAGSILCVAMQTSDSSALLQYVTTATPDEVLDQWEPLLAQYELERGSGIGNQPILNAVGADLEFAIQTDAGTYIVGFGLL